METVLLINIIHIHFQYQVVYEINLMGKKGLDEKPQWVYTRINVKFYLHLPFLRKMSTADVQ